MMRPLLFLLAHFLTTLVKLLGPGGIKAVLTDNLLIKHQPLVLNRSRQWAFALSPWDRGLHGVLVSFHETSPPFKNRGGDSALHSPEIPPSMKDVVRRVLTKHYRPDPSLGGGPSWLTFLGDMKDSLWSVDRFRCESIRLKPIGLWCSWISSAIRQGQVGNRLLKPLSAAPINHDSMKQRQRLGGMLNIYYRAAA